MEQLKKRARLYDRVEDLYSAHEKLNFVREMLNNLTLRTMSKFIMAMEGTPGWQERSIAKEYHATKLGRADGDVFLTELMPLPCPGIHAWPYP